MPATGSSRCVTTDPMEAARVNDRAQLAVAEAELRDRINERWMRRGVTMWDPERTYVDASVHLEPDVVLLPGVVLQGDCRVGAGAEIGPDCHLVDTVVGEGAMVTKSTAVRADIGGHGRVGPLRLARPRSRGGSGHGDRAVHPGRCPGLRRPRRHRLRSPPGGVAEAGGRRRARAR